MILPSLQFRTASHVIPLPEWATFFIKLGDAIASFENASERAVATVVVPTRTLAAALTLMGAVLARSSARVTGIDNKAHFERLRQLPAGTAVIFLDHGGRKRGLLQGECFDKGEVCLRVQTQGYDRRGAGGLVHFVSSRGAHEILPAPADAKWCLPKSQKGRSVLRGSKLLPSLLRDADAYEFAATSRLEAIVLGIIRKLRSEIEETVLTLADNGTATLQDIVRVRKFNSNPADGYRSDIVPLDRRTLPIVDGRTIARAIIFDGSTSFIKWRHSWNDLNACIILDRTDRNFEEAVSVANQAYVQIRISEEGLPNFPNPPRGIDVMVHRERRQ
jgi:hypothetical protein